MTQLTWLAQDAPADAFPPVEHALLNPPGLLVAGGDLSPDRLIAAYKRGIFPWYESGQPILWWSPDPRAVLWPDQLHVSRSLKRTLRKQVFSCSFDREFDAVTAGCAAERKGQRGTWITPEMKSAYRLLHDLGVAHSVETWFGDELAGGLYGVSIGQVFFAESMYARRSDASKVALYHLIAAMRQWGFALLDCQMASTHLSSLGATLLPRSRFTSLLADYCEAKPDPGAWCTD